MVSYNFDIELFVEGQNLALFVFITTEIQIFRYLFKFAKGKYF
jgi:hypothetical protein